MTTKEVYVDAGLIWIGDPCYIMGDDATNRVTDWMDFCDKLDNNSGVSTPLGHGTGVAVSSGYGDGCYPVDIEYNSEGRPSKVTITFIDEDEHDDESE